MSFNQLPLKVLDSPLKHIKRLEVVTIDRSPPTKSEPQMVESSPIWKYYLMVFSEG
ncbi:hypothetical protein RHMOL_Rhmol02G0189200 [Rhododendron molle]|uniref:Uncharacterized protein n=1 Tax=Rhododendron molle TaxID=49168 RepID=A0ACC0PS63_RHOML|nr:hypothetical protein RHMOL_Rhmol02G0189200 [Rhododendron molle]